MPLTRYILLLFVVLIAALATVGIGVLFAQNGTAAGPAVLPLVGLVGLLLRWLAGQFGRDSDKRRPR